MDHKLLNVIEISTTRPALRNVFQNLAVVNKAGSCPLSPHLTRTCRVAKPSGSSTPVRGGWKMTPGVGEGNTCVNWYCHKVPYWPTATPARYLNAIKRRVLHSFLVNLLCPSFRLFVLCHIYGNFLNINVNLGVSIFHGAISARDIILMSSKCCLSR